MSIEFPCSNCGKLYRVKEDCAGRAVKCQQCGATTTAPSASLDNSSDEDEYQLEPEEPAPDKSALMGDFGHPLAGTGAQGTGALEDAQAKKDACPGCGARLAKGAVLCVQCGYDLRTGKRLVPTNVDEKETKERAGRRAEVEKPSRADFFASLLRGVLFSAAGGALGVVLWVVVAGWTERESGYIAWALGFLAGAGMAWGHEDESGDLAGLTAGLVALSGVFLAKLILFGWVLAPQLRAQALPEHVQRAALAKLLLEEQIEERVSGARGEPRRPTPEDYSQAQTLAEVMAPNQMHRRINEALASGQLELSEFAQAVDPSERPSRVGLFFSTMFGPIDGIFILIACLIAYRFGGGQFGMDWTDSE